MVPPFLAWADDAGSALVLEVEIVPVFFFWIFAPPLAGVFMVAGAAELESDDEEVVAAAAVDMRLSPLLLGLLRLEVGVKLLLPLLLPLLLAPSKSLSESLSDDSSKSLSESSSDDFSASGCLVLRGGWLVG